MRAQFGQDILNNAVHGSSNQERAMEEMRAVFGELNFNPDGTVQGIHGAHWLTGLALAMHIQTFSHFFFLLTFTYKSY